MSGEPLHTRQVKSPADAPAARESWRPARWLSTLRAGRRMRRLAEAALLAFMVLMGVDRPAPPIPGHAEWADLAMLAAVVALAIGWLAKRSRWPVDTAITLAALGYAAWAALSAALHGAGGWKALGIAELACVAWVTAALSSGPGERDRLLRVWLWASAVLAAVGLVGAALALARVPSTLYDSRGGDLNLPFRAQGVCVTSNLLASQLLTPLVLLLTEGERLLGRRRRALVLALVGLAFAVTLSRSWLAAALAALLLTTRGWRRAAGVALLLVAALASMRLDLYRSADGAVVVSTAAGLRWRMARSALRSAIDAPLVGVGPAESPAYVEWPRPGDPSVDMAAHDTPLGVAATLGLPALLAFALLFGLVLRKGLRAPAGPMRDALLCALVATLFDGLTVDVENFRHLWILFGLIAGLSP